MQPIAFDLGLDLGDAVSSALDRGFQFIAALLDAVAIGLLASELGLLRQGFVFAQIGRASCRERV